MALKFLDPPGLSRVGNMELVAKQVVEGFLTGRHRSPYHGFSVEYLDHRPYTPGDDLRAMDWKMLARSDKYQVKLYEDETNLRAYILLDCSQSMAFKSGEIDKLTWGSYLAAALTYLLVRQNDAVGLLLFDSKVRSYIPPRAHPTQFRRVLQSLDDLKPGGETDVGSVLHLLVSGFPDSGAGSSDVYEIYGNFIANNPRESLIQACGRLSIHDNILVDAPDGNFAGIYIKNHQGKTLKLVHIYNNTVYSAARGIRIVEQPSVAHSVQGNLVFSGNAISSGFSGMSSSNNITDTVANAGNYVANPATSGSMNFYPLAGQCTGAALTMTAYTGDSHYDLDFNGDSKGSFIHRGAYSGNGTNPGWAVGNTLKTGGPGAGPTTPPALAIASPAAGTLANGYESVSYSVTFTASGGAGGYTWSAPAVDLPSGLALNTGSGVLSGVPTTLGAYTFTVTVTDSNTDTANNVYTINVVTPDPGSGGGGGGGGCSVGSSSIWWILTLPALLALRRCRA